MWDVCAHSCGLPLTGSICKARIRVPMKRIASIGAKFTCFTDCFEFRRSRNKNEVETLKMSCSTLQCSLFSVASRREQCDDPEYQRDSARWKCPRWSNYFELKTREKRGRVQLGTDLPFLNVHEPKKIKHARFI